MTYKVSNGTLSFYTLSRVVAGLSQPKTYDMQRCCVAQVPSTKP